MKTTSNKNIENLAEEYNKKELRRKCGDQTEDNTLIENIGTWLREHKKIKVKKVEPVARDIFYILEEKGYIFRIDGLALSARDYPSYSIGESLPPV